MSGSYFSGRVETIIFTNPLESFYIARVKLDDNGLVTIKGHVPGMTLRVGTWLGFEANWVQHPKFGQQLSITKAPSLAKGWDPDTALNVLVANGVSYTVCHQILSHVGEHSFLSTLESVEALKQVPGLTEFAALHVAERWRMVKAFFQTLSFLIDVQIPKYLIGRVWATFGDDAQEILSSDPWRLVEIDGIRFEQTDEVARRLGLGSDEPARLRGAVVYRTKQQKYQGHLYSRLGQLCAEVRALIPSATNEAVAEALTQCHREHRIVVDREAVEGVTAVYEPWARRLEVDSSLLLQDRQKKARFSGETLTQYLESLSLYGEETERTASTGDLGETARVAVHEWEGRANLTLSSAQKQGVINALTEPVSILTGLPGTGKTTALRALSHILREAEIPLLMVAPTGIAAKNLTLVTGLQGYTIHRAFSAKGEAKNSRDATYAGVVGEEQAAANEHGGLDSNWGFGPTHPHPAKVLVVDEFSMVDQHLLYRLMSCTSPDCRVVCVGDAAQLPSVGPGNVLRDLIRSNLFPQVSLTEIFRQAEQSGIVLAAHKIHSGKVPDVADSDFRLLEIPDEDLVLGAVLRISQRLSDSQCDFQVLSPRHHGTVGVTNLNKRLRELLNPAQSGLSEVKLSSDAEPIREGDRVMVVKNNYRRKVFNGDVGKIQEIDLRKKEVRIQVEGELPMMVTFPFSEVPVFIRLAYASTIHKSQGLEYDHVVMPLVDSFRHQLQRNLLYTAITRAKQKVFLIGTTSALTRAVENDRVDARNTLFVDRLLSQINIPESKEGSETPEGQQQHG